MRQAGVIAAAGIIALEEMVGRLAEDHANASRLAAEISQIRGLSNEPDRARTNIVFFDLVDPDLTPGDFVARLKKKGVLLHHAGPSRFRMVTHYGISDADIDATIEALRVVMIG